MPDEDDLRTVHDILETSFADHFNSHEETFDEFVFRLREDLGHRWDHWWIAELVDEGKEPEPAGTLVGAVREGEDGQPDGSYVEYSACCSPRAAGRREGAARHDHRRRRLPRPGPRGPRGRRDSPTGADALYESMGWKTSYVTQSWHRDVPVTD